MKPRQTIRQLLLLTSLLVSTQSNAQDVAINNNAVFDAVGALSMGIEVALKPRTTMEFYGSIRPWKSTATSTHRHWIGQAQYRFWTCQKFNGFFWGPYVHGGEFNIENAQFPFNLLKGLRTSRYEGWLLGGGIGVGYQYAISKHWNVGAEIGAGYTFIHDKKYDCGVCGNLIKKENYHYFGVSRAALSVIYLF